MKPRLPRMLKTLLSDMRQAIVGIILAAIILSIGGIYLFAKNIWIWLQTTMQLPIPLWAAISLVILFGLYIYLKTRSYSHHRVISKPKISDLALNILIFFGQQQSNIKFNTEELSEEFNITFNQAQIAIDQLVAFDLLNSHYSYYTEIHK